MNKCEIRIGGRAWAQWLHTRGHDALGAETDEMLKDRIERSFELANSPDTYKGQRLPYEPRQGPVWRGPDWVMVWDFEQELQQLCEKFGVELCIDDDLEPTRPTFYLKKNSANPHSEIVIDDRVRDAIVYEVNDDGPDGPREGFEE